MKGAVRAGAPTLRPLACFVLGNVHEAQNEALAAYQSYRNSLVALESLPSHGQPEELKIPFLKNKFAAYEAFIATGLGESGLAGSQQGQEAAFAGIEKAKSRQLADLIAFRANALPAPAGTRSGLVEQVKGLREELNWYYRQVDLQALRLGPAPA